MPSNLDNIGITNAGNAAVFALSARGYVRNITGTTYSLLPSDIGKYLRFTAAGAVTVTVPQDPTLGGFPVSGEVIIESAGAGGVTITAGGTAVIHGVTAALAQYGVRRLRKVAANLYTGY